MKRFILAVLLIIVFSASAHADFLYSYEWPAENDFFPYDISWSFTVPDLLTSTTNIPATSLDETLTTYLDAISYVEIRDPFTDDPLVWTFFEDGVGLGNLAYNQPFDAPGTYFNLGVPDNGTLTISEVSPSVPEPATMLLIGSGLVGLVAFRRKFKS